MNSKYKSVYGCALFTADYVHSPYLVFVCLFFFFMCDYGFISLLTLNYYICKYSFFSARPATSREYIQAIDHTFYGFTGVITQSSGMLGEHERRL